MSQTPDGSPWHMSPGDPTATSSPTVVTQVHPVPAEPMTQVQPSPLDTWSSRPDLGHADPTVPFQPQPVVPPGAPAAGPRASRRTGTLVAVGLVGAGLVAGLVVSSVLHLSSSQAAAGTASGSSQSGLAFGGQVQGGQGLTGQGQGGLAQGGPAQGGVVTGEQRLTGTITAVTSSSVTITSSAGTVSYDVDDQTQIVRDGVQVSLADLKVGDSVFAHEFDVSGRPYLERIFAGTLPGGGAGGVGGGGPGGGATQNESGTTPTPGATV